jgi:hypothetical protein
MLMEIKSEFAPRYRRGFSKLRVLTKTKQRFTLASLFSSLEGFEGLLSFVITRVCSLKMVSSLRSIRDELKDRQGMLMLLLNGFLSLS